MHASALFISTISCEIVYCCMHNKWTSLTEILPIIEFLCFFAAPFSPKTLLEEKGQTVEFAGKPLRIKRSRKQRDRCWPLTGHRIIFCAQSQTSIHISQVTALLRVTSQRLSFPFLKTFAAPFPDPTDCPLVSEDERVADGQVKIRECTLWQWTSIACGIQNKNNTTQQRLRLIKGCWIKILSIWYIYLLPPQGFRPEGEFLRRHSSNSRVY